MPLRVVAPGSVLATQLPNATTPMTVYQQCPFCERVFELGPAEHEPMKRHIWFAHQTSTDSGERRLTDDDDRGTRRSPPPPPVA